MRQKLSQSVRVSQERSNEILKFFVTFLHRTSEFVSDFTVASGDTCNLSKASLSTSFQVYTVLTLSISEVGDVGHN